MKTSLLLEGDLDDAFEEASTTDDDVRMEEEFWHTLYAASKVVLPLDYSEKLLEELWEIKKTRSESLAEYSKRFRALARMEMTLAGLSENSAMCEDALCRLFKRGLPYEWQNNYDASGQVYSTVVALVPFFERIGQGEQRFHRAPTMNGQERRNNNNTHSKSRNNGRNNNRNNSNRSSNNRQQNRSGNPGQGLLRSAAKRQQEEHRQIDHQRGSTVHQVRQANNLKTRVEQRGQHSQSSSDEDYMFAGMNTSPAPAPPLMRVMIKLEHGKEHYHALLDSGCSCSIIHSDFLKMLEAGGSTLEASTVSFVLAEGTTPGRGNTAVRFPRGVVEFEEEGENELCVGKAKDVQPADLLPHYLETALQHCYLKVLEEYHDLYCGRLGRIRLPDYVLPIKPDYKPSHAKPYSIAPSEEDAARREIQRLTDFEVIEQIYGSEPAVPAFFLLKPRGALRLLVDFRRLNQFLQRSLYFVLKIREILLLLTMLNVLKILGYLPFVIVYLDDILIFSKNENDPLEHLRTVFKRLREYGVTLNALKCHILRDPVFSGLLGIYVAPNRYPATG
ncbi:unnamed protein product [Phytophthora fragariaefolia]|uniref:Unnamed protein product n=1 Tax=Phytophthora fragariaefolia TaxID=1490495 RepID=A0A9W6X0H8_9STRA|nr:unnamed protein product [Phytophthora fragariaefolia]